MHKWHKRLLLPPACSAPAAAARMLSARMLRLLLPLLLLCQVSTTYRGQATSDVIPHHIALDPAVPGRLYASDSRASTIYVWDGPEAGTTAESACVDSGLRLGTVTVRNRQAGLSVVASTLRVLSQT